jgi:hypothetical protein
MSRLYDGDDTSTLNNRGRHGLKASRKFVGSLEAVRLENINIVMQSSVQWNHAK